MEDKREERRKRKFPAQLVYNHIRSVRDKCANTTENNRLHVFTYYHKQRPKVLLYVEFEFTQVIDGIEPLQPDD